jgi:translation initiation factor RLI1
MQSKNEIMICEELQPNLSIRGGAKLLFDHIKTIPEDEIIVNFKGSEFISRSFAQEYLKQKHLINKEIREIRVPQNVDSVLKLVKNSPTPNIKEIIENL